MKDGLARTMREFIKKPALFLNHRESVARSIALLPDLDTGAACVVGDDGEVVGALTVRGLLKGVLAAGRDPDSVMVRDVMTTGLPLVSADSCISEALDIMTSKEVRHVLISDNEKIIGLTDIRSLYEAIQELLHRKIERNTSLFASMMAEPYGYDPKPLSSA